MTSTTISTPGYLADLELFPGEASDICCRVYARLPRSRELDEARLSGFLRGPLCDRAQTLPFNLPFVDRGAGPSLLAEAMLADPCFWTPQLPHWYAVTIELRRGDELLAREERRLGISRWGTKKNNLILEGKRSVLRAVSRPTAPSSAPADWRRAESAMLVDDPDDQLCAEASEIGFWLVARVGGGAREIAQARRRLARWPAVAMVWLDVSADVEMAPRRQGDRLLVAQRILPDGATPRLSWADAAIVELSREAAGFSPPPADDRPLLVYRPAEPQTDPAAGRLLCDRLQQDLASRGDFAGYLV